MKLILRDLKQDLVDAWEGWFKDEPGEISVERADIFDGPADCIVSPANSFGIMNGGIDQLYTDRFGLVVQERIQKIIKEEYWGELPVGCAVIVPTDDKEFPWCACAPTMRVPESVGNTLNAYHAFRAVLMAVEKHNRKAEEKLEEWRHGMHLRRPRDLIKSIVSPGLGTATGKLEAELCARQMLCASRAPEWPGDCSEDFTTPYALGEFMKGRTDMAGVPTISRRRRFQLIHAD